jgi:signal transduction histidine kinase
VMQRLFGVSLVIGSGHELSDEERRRCAEEIQAALGDLRDTLSRPLAPSSRATGTTLRGELERLGRHYKQLDLEVAWQLDVPLPAEIEPLAQSILAEALRNADKHASPSAVHVDVGRVDGAFFLEVRNDGREGQSGERRRGAGMGLRLAAFEALQRGGVVEFGPEGGDQWRVRLVVPLP